MGTYDTLQHDLRHTIAQGWLHPWVGVWVSLRSYKIWVFSSFICTKRESLSSDFVFAKRKLNVSLLGSPFSHNHQPIIFNWLFVAWTRLCISGVGLVDFLVWKTKAMTPGNRFWHCKLYRQSVSGQFGFTTDLMMRHLRVANSGPHFFRIWFVVEISHLSWFMKESTSRWSSF